MLEGVCWVFGCEIPEPSNPLLEGGLATLKKFGETSISPTIKNLKLSLAKTSPI
jgi:hypothetical protein